MSLRNDLIEDATARVANALANIAFNRGWPQEHPNEYLKIARVLVEEYTLDPVLDTLADRADEWEHWEYGGRISDLIAVLRRDT